MDRREFVFGAASAAFATLGHSSEISNIAVKLSPPGNECSVMPADFVGLSYEMGQLYPE